MQSSGGVGALLRVQTVVCVGIPIVLGLVRIPVNELRQLLVPLSHAPIYIQSNRIHYVYRVKHGFEECI